jgi:hypothetical protein
MTIPTPTFTVAIVYDGSYQVTVTQGGTGAVTTLAPCLTFDAAMNEVRTFTAQAVSISGVTTVLESFTA